MSEVSGQLTEAASVDVASPRPPSAGELLRQAREASGLHIAALAVALKVPVKKLEALETDRLDLLPDAVFVRALASSVCRALKIDPARVLDQLPQTAVPRLELEGYGLNTPFHTPGDVSRVSIWNQLSRPVVLAALVLLVGALVLIFFPSMNRMENSGATTSEVVVPALVATPVAAAAPLAAEAVADGGGRGRPGAVTEAAVQPAAVTVSPPAQALAAPPVVSAGGIVSAPVNGKASASGVVVFRTRGPSWVEVTDAHGVIQIRRTVVAGEVVGVSGVLPLSVIVGRADITEVQVQGKPFALDAVAKENVARFEVK